MRLFDLHCDTIYACDQTGQSLFSNTLHIDLERGCGFADWRQVMAVWTPDDLRGEAAWQQVRRILRLAHDQAEAYPEYLNIVYTADEMAAIHPHQCGAILALESGAALAGENARLEELAALGVRMITLTWNGENEWGQGCMGDPSTGLTVCGREALQKMNRLGIIPDVSHLNIAGFWEVAERSTRPFVASHSLAKAVHHHPRNLADDQFRAIVEQGGLVGLNFCPEHLGGFSFEQIERHLDHFLCLGGEKTVAIGGDLDGIELPGPHSSITVMEEFYRYLYRKNYEESLLDGLFFSNCNDFFIKALVAFDK